MASSNYFYALGRRKSATARVRVSSGKGSFIINEKTADQYLNASKNLQTKIMRPFNTLELDPEKFIVSVKVNGGGQTSQVEAISLGIAKALVEINEDYRGSLRRAELLGRDPREKERKKPGLRSARKKRQFTKR
jgi:small subunit ribosomal protein S9